MKRAAPIVLVPLLALALWVGLGGDREGHAPVDRVIDVEVEGRGESPELIASPGESARKTAAPGPVETGLVESGEDLSSGAENTGLYIYVDDWTGAPVVDARVTAHWRKGWGNYGEDVGITDASGRYRTTALQLHLLEFVEVRVTGAAPVINVDEGLSIDPRRPDQVHVRVPRTRVLRVEVVDHAGAPVDGAEIEKVFGAPADAPPFVHMLERDPIPDFAPTGPDGTTELALELGVWNVRARAEGHAALFDRLVVLDEADEPAVVALTVLRPDQGHPVRVQVRGVEPDRYVDVWARGTLPDREVDLRPRIDARHLGDHVYEIRLPDVGEWEAGAYRPPERAYARVAPGAREVTIAFEPLRATPSRWLPVRVVSATDGSALRARVETVHRVGRNVSGPGHWCGSDGSVEIEWKSAAPVYLRARLDEHADQFIGPITPEDPGPFTIEMHPARRLAGRVVDEHGLPVACTVRLHRARNRLVPVDGPIVPGTEPSFDTWIDTGPPGEFHFHGVTDGVHRLWVAPEDPALPPAQVEVRGGDEDIVVVLGTGLEGLGTLRGRATDALTGRGLAGVEVALFPSDGGRRTGTVGRSDPDGAFVVRGITPGRHVLRASSIAGTGTHLATAEVEGVEIGAGDILVDVVLHPARILHIGVVDGRGAPVRSGRVRVLWPDGRVVDLQDAAGHGEGTSADIDAAGHATLRGLPACAVTVQVHRGDGAIRDGEPPIGSAEVDLSVPPAARLTIATDD